ncbi:hypothetical protein qdsa002_174 [Staphylococcus phage qdsa002]|uniref:Uncharacterized protein n=1 Tax=Staphylococcus phage qdsa002 TaxID=1970746 RepID=A0A1X9SJ77_9CAUD|nr:hypothetical protein qdsa002_174 [Staphylococcus phage qdsa002]
MLKKLIYLLNKKERKQNLFYTQIEFIMCIEVKNLLENVVLGSKEHLKVNI